MLNRRPMRHFRYARLIAIAVLIAPAATAQVLPVADGEAAGMSSARLERISAAMQRYIDRSEVPGTVTLVARQGKIVHFEALGYRDYDARVPMTTDTIFRIASMTKPITSVAAMMLYEEGHFQLSDPISKWLPEFADMQVAEIAPADRRVAQPYELVPARRPITIKHLLTHTAGLANSYRGITQPMFAELAAQRQPGDTVDDGMRRLAALPLNFHPGDAWEYGQATSVVGRLVEEISGQTLDEFCRERIFEPLGMTDTYFYVPEAKVDRFAALYRPGEGGAIELVEAATPESRWVKEPHVYFSGAGGLVSTPIDYARFLQMLLNGGELDGARLLGPKTIELMTQNHTGDLPLWLPGPGFGFGLGFGVVKDPAATGLPWSKGTYNWGGAFCTYFWVDPHEELFAILMTQVRPYTHLNIRQDLVVLVNQAIVE